MDTKPAYWISYNIIKLKVTFDLADDPGELLASKWCRLVWQTINNASEAQKQFPGNKCQESVIISGNSHTYPVSTNSTAFCSICIPWWCGTVDFFVVEWVRIIYTIMALTWEQVIRRKHTLNSSQQRIALHENELQTCRRCFNTCTSSYSPKHVDTWGFFAWAA